MFFTFRLRDLREREEGGLSILEQRIYNPFIQHREVRLFTTDMGSDFFEGQCKKSRSTDHLQAKVDSKRSDSMAEQASVDPKLFEAFRAGDHQAMKAIVGSFHKRLIGFIRLYTGNREMAEEVAQEVFLAAYLQRDTVRSAEGLRPWLFTVAKRKALRAAEKATRTREVSDEGETLLEIMDPVQAEQWDQVFQGQVGGHLQCALRQLPSRDREMLILRYFGNLQVKEISEVLNIPMGSVGVFLTRSLAKMRRLLEEQGIRPEDVFH
ncbi:MAG: hypothetical protein GHCLOJNM_00517 [bacterium]|nr:hypothetical protein [bacterium]